MKNKNLIATSVFILIAAVAVYFIVQVSDAQSRQVVLSWADTVNPANTTYNVYRAPGLCSGNPNFSRIVSGVTVKTYTDSTVGIGTYCYRASAVFAGLESTPSNTAEVIYGPQAPAQFTAVNQ